MRSEHPISARHDVLRHTRRGLTSLLLAAAMLAPFVAGVVGWPVHTPLGVPLPVHAALLVAIALVAFGLAEAGDGAGPPRRWMHWLLILPLAIGFAAIVHHRANVFYTGRALVEGMAALFALHVGVGLLHRRARGRTDSCVVEHEPPRRWRRGAEWRRRIRARCLPSTPGVRLADALTALVGWLVLAAWALIALEHRHPAGPLLLAAGAAEALAALALVPDALAGMGWLSPRPTADDGDTDHEGRLALERDAAHATPAGSPQLRRQS